MLNHKRLAILVVMGTLLATPALTKDKAADKGCLLEGTVQVTAPKRKEVAPKEERDDLFGDDSYGQTYGHQGYAVPKAPHPLPEEIVLFLKKVPGKYAPPKDHVQLDQKYLQFTHRVLPILKGTTVDFTNHDPVYHNVFSNSKTNHFDLGRKRHGAKASVVMDHSEVPVRVYCEIHSAMKSNILVLDNPFFTVVQPGQKFKIPNIPPGTYTLVAWHDYWKPVEKKITVKSGTTTSVDIVLSRVRN